MRNLGYDIFSVVECVKAAERLLKTEACTSLNETLRHPDFKDSLARLSETCNDADCLYTAIERVVLALEARRDIPRMTDFVVYFIDGRVGVYTFFYDC